MKKYLDEYTRDKEIRKDEEEKREYTLAEYNDLKRKMINKEELTQYEKNQLKCLYKML
jgi:hypothetical protein